MMATVNPCGFALLPAYISLYLRSDADGGVEGNPITRLVKALSISLVVTLGFVTLFGSAGLIIRAGGYFLTRAMPWAGLFVGIIMILLGLWLLISKNQLYVDLATRISTKVKPGRSGSVYSYFIFGLAYGVASLSCALPIFLIVVGSSLASERFIGGMLQFVSYALGMGAVLTVLTLGTAFFKGAVAGYVRSSIIHVERASALLIIFAGAFIVYYWVSIGELGKSITALF